MNTGDISFMILCSVIGLAIVIIGFILFVRHFQRTLTLVYEEKRNAELRYLREINQARMEIKDQTLSYIGKELHDNIGQLLTVSRIHSRSLIKLHPEEKKLKALDYALEKAIEEVKVLSKSLDASRIINFGFLHELEGEVQRLQKLGVCEIRLDTAGDISLPPDRAVILYRIIQEFLNNSLKYSQCATSTIRIIAESSATYIHLSDDGIGFEIKQQYPGSGISNMLGRCEVLDAQQVSFVSQPGEGTTLSFKIT